MIVSFCLSLFTRVCVLLVLKNLRRRSSTVCRSFLPNEDEMISTLSLSKRNNNNNNNSRAFNTNTLSSRRKKRTTTRAFKKGGERDTFSDVVVKF